MNDVYQDRYLAHQARKRAQLSVGEGEPYKKPKLTTALAVEEVLRSRRSQRVFVSDPVDETVINKILDTITYSPNSCNRHGIQIRVVRDRPTKDLLSGLLVGGVGWVHRADTVVLFLADPDAYKSPNEKEFMHYCDVGFSAMAMWTMAEAHGVGAAYINPNIRQEHKEIFKGMFGDGIFCGALALGAYERKALEAQHPTLNDCVL